MALNTISTVQGEGLYTGNASIQSTAGEMFPLLDVYSLEVLHKARGVMMYEQFAMRKTELSAGPGQTIKFITYDDVGRGGQLTELTSLSTKAMSQSVKSISVTEWGNAISVSEKLLQLSFDDLMTEAAILLGRDYAVVRDLSLRDILVSDISQVIYAGGNSAIGNVDSSDILTISDIRKAVEVLQTANVPKFNNDYYVCFIHPHQAFSLRRDSDWISANNYAQTRNVFNGELGRWEDVIFVSTTHQGNGACASSDPGYELALDGTGAAQANLYRATLFGDQCFAVADALPVELRDNGVEDFGRKHSLAWYAIWGVGVLQADYGVHIISA
jgi:N4-gp56 family major capsid protein